MFRFLKKILSRPGPALSVDCASVSERGLVRADNQDSLLIRDDCRVYCVADGMGGGEGGAEASAIMCRTLDKSVVGRLDFSGRIKAMAAAVHEANAEIRAFARRAGYRQMATTVAMMSLDLDSAAPTAIIGYVGDSRVYRLRSGELARLTHDHTLAGELSRRASVRAAAGKLGADADRLSHVLTRAVGIEGDVQTEWRRVDLAPGDAYLVCSDGVYDMAGDAGIRDALASAATARDAVSALAEKTVAAGAADNYTMIVLKLGGAQ